MIRPYVEKDPNAFYDVERFDKAVDTLKNYCRKRSLSIRKQLNGELSAVDAMQEETERVLTDGLDLFTMGRYGSGFFDNR